MFAIKQDLQRCAAGRYPGFYVHVEVSGQDGRVLRAAIAPSKDKDDDARPDSDTEHCVATALASIQFTPFELKVFKIGFPYKFE